MCYYRCTKDSCDPNSGCVYEREYECCAEGCDDHDECTIDKCEGGECKHYPVDCDDGDE
jgi:hypothetical protein